MLRQVLFGLEHEFSVLEVRRVDAMAVKVIIEQAAREGHVRSVECSVHVKDRSVMQLRDPPVAGADRGAVVAETSSDL